MQVYFKAFHFLRIERLKNKIDKIRAMHGFIHAFTCIQVPSPMGSPVLAVFHAQAVPTRYHC